MDCFSIQEEWFSFALKQRAGFGKGGEKNLVVTKAVNERGVDL